MRLVWEREKKGIAYYLLSIPIIILIVIVNIVLITWFIHLLYYLFTDTPNSMSLLEWAERLYELVKRLIDQIFTFSIPPKPRITLRLPPLQWVCKIFCINPIFTLTHI